MVACLAVEALLSTAFFALFLAFGFALGAAAAAFGAPIWLQVILAGVAAALGVALLRPLLVRRLGAGAATSVSGTSMVGHGAITLDEVGDAHHPGHALLSGEHWLAIVEGGEPLPPQTAVMVTAVRGTTLVVSATVAVRSIV